MIYKRPSNFSLYGSLKVLYQKYTCIILTVKRFRATFFQLIYSIGRPMQQEWVLFIVCISWVPSIHQQRSGLSCARCCKHIRKNVPGAKRPCSIPDKKWKRQKLSADERAQDYEETRATQQCSPAPLPSYVTRRGHKTLFNGHTTPENTKTIVMAKPLLLSEGTPWSDSQTFFSLGILTMAGQPLILKTKSWKGLAFPSNLPALQRFQRCASRWV